MKLLVVPAFYRLATLSGLHRNLEVYKPMTVKNPLTGIPDADLQEKRREEIKRLYGDDAQMVTPYKPNRKQRRAQATRLKEKR